MDSPASAGIEVVHLSLVFGAALGAAKRRLGRCGGLLGQQPSDQMRHAEPSKDPRGVALLALRQGMRPRGVGGVNEEICLAREFYRPARWQRWMWLRCSKSWMSCGRSGSRQVLHQLALLHSPCTASHADRSPASQAKERLNAARFGPPGAAPGRPGEGQSARPIAPPDGPGLRHGSWDTAGPRQGGREAAGAGRGFGDARGPPPPLHAAGPGPRGSVFARLSSGIMAPPPDRGGPGPRRMGSGSVGDDRAGSGSLDRRRSGQV